MANNNINSPYPKRDGDYALNLPTNDRLVFHILYSAFMKGLINDLQSEISDAIITKNLIKYKDGENN